jgi:hypothetical protein
MRLTTYALLVGALLWSTAIAGRAQDSDSRSPPRSERVPAPGQLPGPTVVPKGTAPKSLSDELNRSGGVPKPPPTLDPGAVLPPVVDEDPMPVIPPPGSPGGDQQVEPK